MASALVLSWKFMRGCTLPTLSVKRINRLNTYRHMSEVHQYSEFVKDLEGKEVCLVGEGDFGFCRALSKMSICKSIDATTMDSEHYLYRYFL